MGIKPLILLQIERGNEMKKFKVILEKIEVLFYLWFSIKVLPLHFSVPYNFWLFLFDFTFGFVIFSDLFLIKMFEKNPKFAFEKYNLLCLRIFGILSIIILAKYTDFFENIFSAVFK